MIRTTEHEMLYTPRLQVPYVAESVKGEVSRLLMGTFAGFVATAPMTVAMRAMEQQLPFYERQHLPPSQSIMVR